MSACSRLPIKDGEFFVGFISATEALLSIGSIALNAFVAVAMLFPRHETNGHSARIPTQLRRTFASIYLNYCFTAAVLLAKTGHHFIFISSAHFPLCLMPPAKQPPPREENCEMQRLPLIFAYIHSGALPLLLAVYVRKLHCKKNRLLGLDSEIDASKTWWRFRRRQTWFHMACSFQQLLLMMACVGCSLVFVMKFHDSVNDNKAPSKEGFHGAEWVSLWKCPLFTALTHDRAITMPFLLLTLLISLHLLSFLAWEVWCAKAVVGAKHSLGDGIDRVNERPLANHPHSLLEFAAQTRRLLVYETFAWLVSLFLTGTLLVCEFTAQWKSQIGEEDRDFRGKGMLASNSTATATTPNPARIWLELGLEMSYVMVPALVGLAHPLCTMRSIEEVYRATRRLMPERMSSLFSGSGAASSGKPTPRVYSHNHGVGRLRVRANSKRQRLFPLLAATAAGAPNEGEEWTGSIRSGEQLPEPSVKIIVTRCASPRPSWLLSLPLPIISRRSSHPPLSQQQ